MARLYMHEAKRVYGDKLIEPKAGFQIDTPIWVILYD